MTDVIAVSPRPRPGRQPGWRAPVFIWANSVVLGWLAVAVVMLAAGEALDVPQWLALHALLLGAVTNAIVIWSEHFVVTWCRMPAPSPRRLALGLTALNLFVIAVLTGVALNVTALGAVGGTGVAVIATVHTIHLVVMRRATPVGRFGYLAAFYTAASACLIAGAVSGAGLVLGGSGWYVRIWAAHVHVVLLGWVGLSVVGTLFTLWPTTTGSRITPRTEVAAHRSLPMLGCGLVVAVSGMLADSVWVSVLGLAGYATGLVVSSAALWSGRRPRGPAAWMFVAAMAWLGVAVLVDAVGLAAAGSLEALPHIVGSSVVPILVVGFAAQVLVGALTQLLPAVLSHGSTEHRAIAGILARGWVLRIAAANIAVPLVAWGPSQQFGQIGWVLAALAVVAFVLLASRVVAAVALHREITESPGAQKFPGTTTGVLIGLVAVVLALVLASTGQRPTVDRPAAGPVQTVDVVLRGMRIQPANIEVPAGTRLVLRVTNQESTLHDLRLDSGEHTPLLGPGQSATLDAGTVTTDRRGWCDVAGHRAAGMTMAVHVSTGSPLVATPSIAESSSAAAVPALDLSVDPSPGWTPRDAALAPVNPGVHRLELHAMGADVEVAPGRREHRWTFGGTAPGPTLHGRVGDQFEITLVNDTTMGHGIDFHAGALAPDGPMRTIAPGERLVYRFTAQRAGAWLYHCSTMPMSLHIANGMYGAVIIDPPALAPVAREYVLISAQLYLGAPGSDAQMHKLAADQPDGWMFNGMAAQYDHAPLIARTGERVRIWVVNAGPNDSTAFHVVGGQFDTVYREGAWVLRPTDGSGGAQVLDLGPAQGGFVELGFDQPGHYPFVDHDMRHGENGAHGLITVTEAR
ncbi:Multicopper oxidase, type 3 [uncultured Mycobacterium sp.]|uniref:Copper-containing nitrite reductase n=1 Tax=uncultured Mycobacterium sp. TaxID=171292 RepID=A0A1Y5NYV7_9MYCO|nr:Multicopper oxidase, type 3 [uncultured Mycobacterium sp.]